MSRRQHLLLYEPRTEGHHLGWLRFITEDLLSAGGQLTLAVDLRPSGQERVHAQLGNLLDSVTLINAYDASGRRHGDRKAGSVAFCLRQSGADAVFLCALDEIASSCWRRAAFGFLPPPELRGKMGGIYHRPRFFSASPWTPDRWLKLAGWRRLIRDRWFRQLLFVDEFLAANLQAAHPSAPIYFLPDVCPPGYDGDAAAARKQLGLPPDRQILLFYGTGARRKGLHLAVSALLQLPVDSPAFLLCAGQQNPEGQTARDLEQLVRQNRALLINRYISDEEEKNCFAASDAILLPYLNHFGTSGVLSRAMAASRPVIVSDEQLLGQLVRERGLGLLFPPGNISALAGCYRQISTLDANAKGRFAAAARLHAERYSRAAFRNALLRSLQMFE
jgi:glycosyltransferase involved in cell wall biosynthesis